MAELNLLEMISYVWSVLVSTNGLQLIGIELILLIAYAITTKIFKDKFIKMFFAGAEIFILGFYAYDSISYFQVFLNNVVTNITEIVFFPTPLELLIVLLISYAISYSFNKKCKSLILKSINVLVPLISTCMVVAMVKYMDVKSIAFDEFSVFTNKTLMSMHELVMIMFVVWIALLVLVSIDVYVLKKLAHKHEVVEEKPDLVTVHIEALDTPDYVEDEEDEEEIEMPRLKASYMTCNQI